MALLFENAPCSRCGGSGRFSWCQAYGYTCFKCHGDGVTLTKRGRAAQDYLTGLRSRTAGIIEVGDVIQVEDFHLAGSRTYFASVTAIEPATCYKDDETNAMHVSITARNEKLGNGATRVVDRGTRIRVGFSKAEKTRQREEALEYQAALTKAGKPRKRQMVA